MNKQKKFDKGKCSYCKRGNHPENLCMKKTIEQMSMLLKQNNIFLPEGANKSDVGNNIEYHERFHALKAYFSQSQIFSH